MGITGQSNISKVPTTPNAPRAVQSPAKSSFADAQPRGPRAQLQPVDDYTAGIYTVRVNRLKRIPRTQSKSPQKCESSTIELEVIESNVPKCPAGYTASVTFTDRYYEDIYFSDVKGFLCGLLNAEPGQIDDADWSSVFGDTAEGAQGAELQALAASAGQFCGHLVNVMIKFKLREGKHPISQYVWTPNEEQHPEAT